MSHGILYLLAILFSNLAFSYLPLIHTPLGGIPPATFLVGAVFVLRDYSQRAVGHRVLYFMLAGIALSYLLASPELAIASAAAFLISEGVDWGVYTTTKKPFHQRVLLSSVISVPVDSFVFLYLLGVGGWGAFLIMVASKMLAGGIVWWVAQPSGEHAKTRLPFTTYSGIQIPSLEAFDLDHVRITDIAHSLSMQCRFAGHCAEFYSVAQHSVLVAERCPPAHRLQALLHDASEAYLVDLPRPVKDQMPDYRRVEAAIQKVICCHIGVPYQLDISVHNADYEMLLFEIKDLTRMPWSPSELMTFPAQARIVPLPPKQARELFLSKFMEYLELQNASNRNA